MGFGPGFSLCWRPFGPSTIAAKRARLVAWLPSVDRPAKMHSDLALALELQALVSAASNSSFTLGIKHTPKGQLLVCETH